jgi:hypothetical protein
MLKRKLLELTKEDKESISKETTNILDTLEIKESPIEEEVSKETVSVDVPKLKNILYNRLKSYHENHIEKLISQYGLDEKKEIEKETMEKILLEAIHV